MIDRMSTPATEGRVPVDSLPHRLMLIRHEMELVDEDGQTVRVQTPQGPMLIRAEGTVRCDAGPDMSVGQVGDVPFVAPVGAGLPLTPGSTYVWQLWLDGNTRDDWRCAFYVRAQRPS